ncbi:MAG: TrmJ/YjtD family RNA methyltransferase [Candidatus Micrarchaeota archaeon]|nr:TrmJ/YjtD family RNA methyltransferase [Candidatus Micrarchaeota archaeon]
MKPERFKVVLVEPEYEVNVGSVARAMANFGFSDLAFVRPRCNPTGPEAVKYSKHAKGILLCAKSYPSLPAATKNCRIVVGTTGVLYRHWDRTFRTPIALQQLKPKLRKAKEGKIALVFGNEGIGLSEKDISSCDFLTTIPASESYPVLNLSHAVAVCLYELSSENRPFYAPAGKKEKEALISAFLRLVARYSASMRNPRKAGVAFRRMVGRAMLAEKECAAILGVVRRCLRELEERGK